MGIYTGFKHCTTGLEGAPIGGVIDDRYFGILEAARPQCIDGGLSIRPNAYLQVTAPRDGPATLRPALAALLPRAAISARVVVLNRTVCYASGERSDARARCLLRAVLVGTSR